MFFKLFTLQVKIFKKKSKNGGVNLLSQQKYKKKKIWKVFKISDNLLQKIDLAIFECP